MATEKKSYYDSYDSFKSTGIGEFGEIPMSKWDSGLCKKKLVPLAKCRNLDIKFFRENESGAKLKPT